MKIGLEAGTQVITKRGDVSIEHLTTSDEVLTSFGEFSKVVGVSNKIYRGAIYLFEIYGKPNLHCASNVKVYTMVGEERVWKNAEDLNVKDEVCFLAVDEDGVVMHEWVRIRKRMVITGACRYLYGIDVESGESYTSDGYIVSTL